VNEQVIVRGERERGEVEALNRERTADNIVQVLPARSHYELAEHEYCGCGGAVAERVVGAR